MGGSAGFGGMVELHVAMVVVDVMLVEVGDVAVIELHVTLMELNVIAVGVAAVVVDMVVVGGAFNVMAMAAVVLVLGRYWCMWLWYM